MIYENVISTSINKNILRDTGWLIIILSSNLNKIKKKPMIYVFKVLKDYKP